MDKQASSPLIRQDHTCNGDHLNPKYNAEIFVYKLCFFQFEII